MKRLKHLLEERARIAGEMNAIMAKCETENRSRTPEEKTLWSAKKTEADAMEDEIRDLQAQEEVDRRSAKPVGKPADEVETRKQEPEDMSIRGQVTRWVEANKQAIEEIRSGQRRDLPILEIRAAATMTVAGVNVGSSVFLPNAGVEPGINDLNRVKPTFWNRLRKGRTKLNPYVWINKTNKQGNATFIGEGVLKPLASFELTAESSVPKKVAERFKVSTELLHDIDGMTSFIENEARFEVETAANTASLTGTASSTSPAGITTIAAAFTTTAIDVQVANNYDAIRAAAAQLKMLNYDRDIVAFVNPVDGAEMDMAKGTDGHYVMPPFATANGVVKGVTVIEDSNIAAGFLLIGDMSKYHVLMYQDFHVAWGWENDDFSKNLVTMVAEMRFHQFFKANDAGAFIYDAFSDIKTAIFAT